MRILQVIPSYLPARRYGGPIFATHALCRALVKAGCEVTVYTSNVDGAGESDVPVNTPVDIDGVKVWYFRSPFLRRLVYVPAMARKLDRDCPGFDVLHLHSVYLWPTWAAARAARRYRKPYIISPRGMLVQDVISRKNPLLKTVWISLIERRNLKSAAGIHVTSAVEASELQKFGFTLPKIYKVPNGVDAEGAGEEDVRELPSHVSDLFRRGCPIILCLGRINWKKGLDRLISAMTRVRDAMLLIVGNDEEGYTATLTEIAMRQGVSDRVMFSGPVYGHAKAKLYQQAKALVLPSYSENFGNVVLEAMYEGCPVVVTPEVGAASIVESVGGGLVTSGDPEALASTITRLLSDDILRTNMGRDGREAMMSNYSWATIAARILQIYREIIVHYGAAA